MTLKLYTGTEIPENALNGVYFPTGNMHPVKVVEYAKKLIIMGNVYNISVITYDPVLIEAIVVWSEFYNTTVEYYLNNEPLAQYMGEYMYCYMYEDLSHGYDEVDRVKYEILLR